MEVRLTPDQKAFVQQAIESGRLSREEEAIQEALSLWEERERLRAEILASVDAAEDSLAMARVESSQRNPCDSLPNRLDSVVVSASRLNSNLTADAASCCPASRSRSR